MGARPGEVNALCAYCVTNQLNPRDGAKSAYAGCVVLETRVASPYRHEEQAVINHRQNVPPNPPPVPFTALTADAT